MKEFPKLKEGQFALMAADKNTGHVLDIDLKVIFNDVQQPYLIFETKEEALKYANDRIRKISDVEYVLYDHGRQTVQVVE